MTSPTHYNYIVAGGGAAGLSLVWKMHKHLSPDKKILLIDKSISPDDTKTWCFWSDSTLGISPFITKSWDTLITSSPGGCFKNSIHPYSYHAVRSYNYSKYILDACRRSPNIDLLEANIRQIKGHAKRPAIWANKQHYTADWIFQSCFRQTLKAPRYPLGQHFIGWDIETDKQTFDHSSPVFMDLDEDHIKDGTAFMYKLPWSDSAALFEYTIFSDQMVETMYYEQKIRRYLKQHYNIEKEDYQIERKERGFIPMEDRIYKQWYAQRVLSVGFSSGISKPSSGYTFKNIQLQSQHIVERLKAGLSPEPLQLPPSRYHIYDLLLLNILHEDETDIGIQVFDALFTKNKFPTILKFLDEKTSILQDLFIMASVPALPFLSAIRKNRKFILQKILQFNS